MDGYVPPFCWGLFGVVIIVVLLRWIFSGESGEGTKHGKEYQYYLDGIPTNTWSRGVIYNPNHPANHGRRKVTYEDEPLAPMRPGNIAGMTAENLARYEQYHSNGHPDPEIERAIRDEIAEDAKREAWMYGATTGKYNGPHR